MPTKQMNRKYKSPMGLVTANGKKVMKSYSEMNPTELREAMAEFDQEFVADTFKPLSAHMRSEWERIKRGRPKVGAGVKVVSVSLERGLLTKADRLAKKLKISRAKLISQGLETMLLGSDKMATNGRNHRTERSTSSR